MTKYLLKINSKPYGEIVQDKMTYSLFQPYDQQLIYSHRCCACRPCDTSKAQGCALHVTQAQTRAILGYKINFLPSTIAEEKNREIIEQEIANQPSRPRSSQQLFQSRRFVHSFMHTIIHCMLHHSFHTIFFQNFYQVLVFFRTYSKSRRNFCVFQSW